jgi:uncharacterized lipoprotein YmbA
MKLPRPSAPAALLAALATACASSPVALVALPDAPPVAAEQVSDQRFAATILLRTVTIPGHLDNFPVVIGRTGNTLMVSGRTEWAERLSDGVARVLRGALSQRLGASRVTIPGDGRVPDADLTVEFLALDPQQHILALDANWSYSCRARGAANLAGRTRLQVPLNGPTASAVADGMADALGRFADVLVKETVCNASAPPAGG